MTQVDQAPNVKNEMLQNHLRAHDSGVEKGVEEIEAGSEKDSKELRSDESLKGAPDNDFLQAPLQPTRSRSSARSQTDGYSHIYYNDEEKNQQSTDPVPEAGKEFEVKFDGDSDPWNPKTSNSTFKKWCIVLIGSGCSLCVTCASAMYVYQW